MTDPTCTGCGHLHGATCPYCGCTTPGAEPCENCDGRKCMGCIFREYDHECQDDCPMCCTTPGADDDTAWRARALKAEEEAAQWEKLWRDDIETAKQALAERDEALAELAQIRGEQ